MRQRVLFRMTHDERTDPVQIMVGVLIFIGTVAVACLLVP